MIGKKVRCPKCGNTAVIIGYEDKFYKNKIECYMTVECDTCKAKYTIPI